MFTPALSVVPAEAGIQRMVGLDSRLRGNDKGGGNDKGRGNDKGVGFVQTYQGSIFVAMTENVAFFRCNDNIAKKALPRMSSAKNLVQRKQIEKRIAHITQSLPFLPFTLIYLFLR